MTQEAPPLTHDNEHHDRAVARGLPLRGPVTLAELCAGLVWPALLRAPALAVQPPRVALGVLIVAVVAVVARLFDGGCRIIGAEALAGPLVLSITDGVRGFVARLLDLQLSGALAALYRGVFAGPFDLLASRPFAGAVLLLLVTPAWMIGGGALCRMVALDVAGHINLSLRESLGFALRRAGALVFAMLIPILSMGAIALLMAVVGWLLLSLPVVDFIGALGYGLFMAAGFLVVLLFVGFVAGQAMLAPAVAAEGTDALDAVQRAYAYVLGRPARLALYALGALALGAVAATIAGMIVDGGVRLTSELTGAWLSDARFNALRTTVGTDDETLSALLIHRWEQLAMLLLVGFTVSLYFALSTVVYLLVRRVNDEQDLREVWLPGTIEGTTVGERSAPGA